MYRGSWNWKSRRKIRDKRWESRVKLCSRIIQQDSSKYRVYNVKRHRGNGIRDHAGEVVPRRCFKFDKVLDKPLLVGTISKGVCLSLSLSLFLTTQENCGGSSKRRNPESLVPSCEYVWERAFPRTSGFLRKKITLNSYCHRPNPHRKILFHLIREIYSKLYPSPFSSYYY